MPEFREEYREALVRVLEKNYGPNDGVYYTDAADYARRRAMIATVTKKDRHVTSLTLKRVKTLQAEEIAVALAITQTILTTAIIMTDSQSACRSYEG